MKHKVNDRIFYTGDMANIEGFGTIENIENNQILIKLDDGRFFKINSAQLDVALGQRFKPISQYNAEREEKIKLWNEFASKQKGIK